MKNSTEPEVKPLNRLTIIQVYAIPPSVNHYKVPIASLYYDNGRRKARISGFRRTREAKNFEDLIAIACRGSEPVYGREFEIEIEVTLGPKQRGDWDNFTKVVCDSIAKMGMLRNQKNGKPMSDAHITRGEVVKERGERSMATITLIGVS